MPGGNALVDGANRYSVGTEPFASGLGIVDQALVTVKRGARTNDSGARSATPVLVDVEIADVATIATDLGLCYPAGTIGGQVDTGRTRRHSPVHLGLIPF